MSNTATIEALRDSLVVSGRYTTPMMWYPRMAGLVDLAKDAATGAALVTALPAG